MLSQGAQNYTRDALLLFYEILQDFAINSIRTSFTLIPWAGSKLNLPDTFFIIADKDFFSTRSCLPGKECGLWCVSVHGVCA